MSTSTLERLVRRDRLIVAVALGLLVLLAWAYVIALAAHMSMMDDGGMAGMGMPGAIAPKLAAWSSTDAAFMFLMWAVMMVAMMTPSVAPMVLVHARVARQAVERGNAFAATGWFAAGYLLAWTGFAAVATVAQWGLERISLLTPGTAATGESFGGTVLIAAGLYQWTRMKDACLEQCQSPLVFIQRHGLRADACGSLVLGAKHGMYCVGCCWALMLLLFVGGVMNVLWIVAISAFVLLEKLVPARRIVSRVAGTAFIASGVWLVTASLS
jgi:predicted metal-binding membrane protein